MEWTDERCLKLIDEYRKHPVIWDNTHEYHKLYNKKYEAWIEISNSMGFDVSELKRKINSLLASYRRERQKIKLRKLETGMEEECSSSWFAFRSFDFLTARYQPRLTKPELVYEYDPEEDYDDSPQDDEVIEHKFEVTEPFVQGDDNLMYSSNRPLKRKRDHEDPRIGAAYNVLQSLAHKKRDHFDAFGEYIASRLRLLDRRSCTYVEKAISDVLFDAEMGKFIGKQEQQ